MHHAQKILKSSLLSDFKSFIMKGNVVDMAVGIIIGASFGSIVSSIVKDVIMPPIGMALGNIDFSNLSIIIREGNPVGPYATLAAAQAAGAITINYGMFINTVINFLIIAAVVFFFIIRPLAHLQSIAVKPAAVTPTTRDCPFCATVIPLKATRCPNCTSELAK
jgi:large conductance mechanosensitive channel